MYKGYTRICQYQSVQYIPVYTVYIPVYTSLYTVYTGIYQSVQFLGKSPRLSAESSVYTVLYFLTNFILGYASVLLHLSDRNCPICMCHISAKPFIDWMLQSVASTE